MLNGIDRRDDPAEPTWKRSEFESFEGRRGRKVVTRTFDSMTK
jgi:hypothetical protein